MDEFFVRNRLSAYIDGELPASEARDVEAALAHNPGLRAEYDGMRAAVQLLREHGPMSAPAGFDQRLAERLAREPMPLGWRRWTRGVRPELVMLAAVAAAALLYVGLPSDDSPVGALPGSPDQTAAKQAETHAGEPPADEVATSDALRRVAAPPAGGVDGDEGFAAARRDAEQQLAAGPPPGASIGPGSTGGLTAGEPGRRGGTEKEAGVVRDPYLAPYESNSDVTIAGSTVFVRPGGAADPATDKTATDKTAASAPTSANQQSAPPPGVSVYSPPPYRYRVRSGDEAMLKQLYAAAASLGGHLTDGEGRAVAIHMLESGEVKVVRVVLPGKNVDALTAKLRALGDLETMAADRGMLYAPGADVPVEVELERE